MSPVSPPFPPPPPILTSIPPTRLLVRRPIVGLNTPISAVVLSHPMRWEGRTFPPLLPPLGLNQPSPSARTAHSTRWMRWIERPSVLPIDWGMEKARYTALPPSLPCPLWPPTRLPPSLPPHPSPPLPRPLRLWGLSHPGGGSTPPQSMCPYHMGKEEEDRQEERVRLDCCLLQRCE